MYFQEIRLNLVSATAVGLTGLSWVIGKSRERDDGVLEQILAGELG